MAVDIPSPLPVAAILVPLAGAVVIYLVGLRWRGATGPLAALALAVTFGLCAWIAALVLGGGARALPLSAAKNHFLALYVDGLSALLLIPTSLLGLLAALFSLPALPAVIARGHGRAERLPLYYALLTLFVGTMLWACSTNNIIVLWIAVEATTLASALLVAFYWDRRSLEAGYKYLLLLTVGITFALFGCVLLYSAAAGQFPHPQPIQPMLITEITKNAALLASRAPTVVIMAVVFLVIGFGTKTGLVPFHAWLPDAQSEAPPPVAALLSGVLEIAGAYALVRTTAPFLFQVRPLVPVLLALGSITMLVGIGVAAAQDDLKRLLAYSSVSQLGYVVLGFGVGTYLGLFGGLFHLLNHAFAKALLFFSAGAVEHATGQRALSKLGGLRASLPCTAIAFFVGALALGGVPGLNGFLSKLTIFLAAADRGLWWAAVIAVLTGLFTLIVLTNTGVKVFLGPAPASASAQAQEAPGPMLVALTVLALLCVLLGMWPPLAQSLVGPAAQGVVASIPAPPGAPPTVLSLLSP
jgi:hydrogenase-4 component F